MAGAAIAIQYNVLRQPPSVATLFRPAINLTALGLPIYGYTLLASAMDHVRRRPTWIGSVLTLAGFIIWVISLIPVFHDSWWRPWLEKFSIFKAYNPVELVKEGQTLEWNLAILCGVGVTCIALAFLVFAKARSAGQRLTSNPIVRRRLCYSVPSSGSS